MRTLIGIFTALLVVGSTGAAIAQTVPAERDVTFHNGNVQLAGTLMTPDGGGPHPAIVFLHGSGPVTRAGARPYAQAFARLGFASLFFDKRGSGKSGGSWTAASLEDLAGDARAAVRFVQGEPGIDRTRVGFWGVSQAGWVGTLAAAGNPDVAFLIVISGGGATPRESELFSYRKSFEAAGLPDDEKSDAFDVLAQYFQFLATGQNRQALVQRLEASKGRKWYPLARLDQILPSESNVANWQWVATWDPLPHIAKVTVPVLLIFGDRDSSHPHETAIRRWREGLEKAGNMKATIVVFPGADHGIRVREGFSGTGRPPLAAGYAELMHGWLWMHILSR